jgi:Family of unknown function (DUF5362)
MTEYPVEPPLATGPGSGEAGTATLTPQARLYLDQTRPWVRFMSTVTFLSAGLMALLAFVMLVLGMAGGLAGGDRGLGALGGAIGGGLIALLYLSLACVYIAPGLFLSRYASAIKRLQTNCSAAVLEDAIKHQKSFWRFIGILTIIGIVVGVIVMGLAVMAGVIGAMMSTRA